MNVLREALLRGRRRPRHAGAGSPTLHRGDGYEFVELREYVPGDDVRRIDWAATARSGDLQTRVVLEDVAVTFAAVLDTSESMNAGRTRPLIQSAREAIDRWFSAAESGDRRIEVREASFLAGLDAASRILPRGAALLIVSDFYDLPGDRDLITLLGRRFDCTALVAADPWQNDLGLSGFVTIADAESNWRAPLFIGQAERLRYARASRERERNLLEGLESANIRAGMLGEEEGASALLAAFGLR